MVARRAAGASFTLPEATAATHLLGTGAVADDGTPGGGTDLVADGGEVVVPASDAARFDVWLLG